MEIPRVGGNESSALWPPPSEIQPGHTITSSIKKSLLPLRGARTENTFSAVPPCLPLSRPLIPVPTHRLPHNAGIASKILGPKPVPFALCGPFAAPLHAPLSAPGTLCGGDKQLYFRFVGFKICYAYLTPSVCVCQVLFFAGEGQIGVCRCARS